MINPCSICGAGCCKTYTITVTAFDIIRAAEASGKPSEDFARMHEMRLLSFDPGTVLETSDGYGYYVLGFKSHPCAFLDRKGACAIHGSAPLCCKRYPHVVGPGARPMRCPLLSKLLFALKKPEITGERVLLEIRAYKELVAQWNRKPGRKSDCIGFLLSKARSAERNASGSASEWQ